MDRLTALDRLMSTIHGHQTGGDYIPCVDQRRGHLWLSDQKDMQEAAVRGCLVCPALVACGRYVDEWPEVAGTWAGKPNSRVGKRPKELR